MRMRALLPAETWRRNQIAITVAGGLVFFGFTLVMPFFPFYVRSLGVHDMRQVALWSGVYLTITPLIAASLGPLWARVGEKVSKTMVHRVLFTIALHWGLMYFARTVWHVLALRVLLGLFSGFATMSVALVTHGCPKERLGHSVGTLQAVQILATAFGPFVGGVLAHAIGIRATFLVTCGMCATAWLFVLLLYHDTAAAPDEDEAGPVVLQQEGPVSAGVRAFLPRPGTPLATRRLRLREAIDLPAFLAVLPLLFVVSVIDRSLMLSVPMYLANFVPARRLEEYTGLVVSASAFAGAASAFLLGRRAARTGPLPLLRLSLLAGGAAILPMAFCRSVLAFGVLRAIVALTAGGAATLAYTLGGASIPSAVRASVYSFLSGAAMFGGSLGPLLSGLLNSRDPGVPFLVCAALYLALALQTIFLSRRAAPDPALAAGEASRDAAGAAEERW
jgi:DHA1 family multidrug resistance protein-like MFS transporter